MPDTSPLSIESAVELMRMPAPSEEKDKGGAAQADKQTDKAAQAAEEKSTDTDASADAKADKEADKDTSAKDQRDESDEDVEQGDGDALPPIEPPSFWKAEDKAAFNDLPRAAQEVIHRREQERDTQLRTLQNSQADQRKTVEAEVTKLKGMADKVSAYVANEVKALAKEFPEIKSEADVTALAMRDPARFSLFQARLMEFNAAQQAQAEAQTVLQQKANEAQQEQLQQAKTALLTAFPAWKDGAVAKKELTELQDYAISQGATPEAARSAFDPLLYKMAQKAMLYDKAQKAKAEALTREPPRVQKPGVSNTNTKADRKEADRQTRLNKLDKTHSLEDAIGLLRL